MYFHDLASVKVAVGREVSRGRTRNASEARQQFAKPHSGGTAAARAYAGASASEIAARFTGKAGGGEVHNFQEVFSTGHSRFYFATLPTSRLGIKYCEAIGPRAKHF